MRTARKLVLAAVAAGLLVSTVTTAAMAADEGNQAVERGPAETCVPAVIPFDAEDFRLTGRWSADDGGMYYVRQIGDKVWWSGMSDYEQRHDEIGRDWNNVGFGTLEGTTISLEFADVPRGNIWGDGKLTVSVGADPDGNLRATRMGEADFGGSAFTPCQPEPLEFPGFARPFSYSVPFGLASATWTGSTDLQVMNTPEVPESGISFWTLGPGWQTTCSAPSDLAVPTDWSPESVVEYLRAIPDLAVGESTTATVAGLPALMVDVTTAEGTFGCDGDGYVRMFKESGNESSMAVGHSARLFLVDADGATFAIEIWGADPEAWWPLAQGIVDSVSIDPAAAPTETVGEAADDGARVVRVDVVDERTRDLVIESPSVGYARVRLLLPDGWEEGSADSWPTLYLLHGAWDDYTSWTRETDVADIPELRDVLVVMPDAGQFGWYSDWQNGGSGGQPAWETFHTVELPQLIESNWGGGTDRVVAGLSMGGFGALSYAARHPGMFKAAAAYSGVVDTIGSDFDAEALMWGDKGIDPAWEAHNPLSQAAALEGTDLYISYGDGSPGPLDSPGAQFDGGESWLASQNGRLVTRLEELGIPATVDAYGDGTHSWPYWERGLHESLPVLLGALAE